MKRAGGFFLAALLASCAFAQTITRSFGSVIFPGGTSATNPNITRTFGSVVFPGGSPTSIPVRSGAPVIPPPSYARPSSGFSGGDSFGRGSGATGGNSFQRSGNARGNRATPIYAYPLYMPGFYDTPVASDPVPSAQQPNVTVVYPAQQDARPIVIQLGPDSTYPVSTRQSAPSVYQPAAPPEPETPHYLLAFKDHTVYTAVAYWFDGDTVHYFTRGDTHNQASVALLDRELTERLNRDLGIDFKMPAAK